MDRLSTQSIPPSRHLGLLYCISHARHSLRSRRSAPRSSKPHSGHWSGRLPGSTWPPRSAPTHHAPRLAAGAGIDGDSGCADCGRYVELAAVPRWDLPNPQRRGPESSGTRPDLASTKLHPTKISGTWPQQRSESLALIPRVPARSPPGKSSARSRQKAYNQARPSHPRCAPPSLS
jgi:hypothetical protein